MVIYLKRWWLKKVDNSGLKFIVSSSFLSYLNGLIV